MKRRPPLGSMMSVVLCALLVLLAMGASSASAASGTSRKVSSSTASAAHRAAVAQWRHRLQVHRSATMTKVRTQTGARVKALAVKRTKPAAKPKPTSSPTPTAVAVPTASATPTSTTTTSASSPTSTTSASSPTPSPSTSPSSTVALTPGPWFGVLQQDPARAATVAAAGVKVAHLAVGWDSYEPSRGSWNASYLSQIRSRYATLRSAGMQVVLDLGVQYPPNWVFSLPGGTRWVDQYGDVYTGSLGNDMPDAVWNSNVRAALGEYIARAGQDLGDLAWLGVRVGGGPSGELRLPEPNYNGHTNAFWGFGQAALASNPVPTWRPGQADTAKASAFLDWYLTSMKNYLAWQLDSYRSAFGSSVQLQVLQPSWGVRPGEIDLAVAGSLNGGSRGEKRQTLQQGLDWARQLPVVAAHPRVVVSSTWLDAGDQGTDAVYESPVRYLVRLAAPLGVGVMGENTGSGSAAAMQLCVSRVRELGLVGMLWMAEPQLYSGAYATLSDYQRLIAGA